MSVLIGSARIDERGKINGGKAGDQTGAEISTQAFYVHSKGWVVLRAKRQEVREAIAKCMEKACSNNKIGYDQYQRNTLYNKSQTYNFDVSKVTVQCECDCSSLVRVCVAYAGINAPDFNTSSQAKVLVNTGEFDLLVFTSEEDLFRGDILVTKTKGHTVVALTNGKQVKKETFSMELLKKSIKGNDVTVFEVLMKKLGYYTGSIDKTFGEKCHESCIKFQEKYPECGTNGKPDGEFGTKSWTKLFSLNK